MTFYPFELTMVQICYARTCRHNSDYGVEDYGRPWLNLCLRASSGLMVRIGEKGKCTEYTEEAF